jgi:hypothetical protein
MAGAGVPVIADPVEDGALPVPLIALPVPVTALPVPARVPDVWPGAVGRGGAG